MLQRHELALPLMSNCVRASNVTVLFTHRSRTARLYRGSFTLCAWEQVATLLQVVPSAFIHDYMAVLPMAVSGGVTPMAAIWYNSKPKDFSRRRKAPRRSARLPALLRAVDEPRLLGRCLVIDVSEGGARLKFEAASEVPQSFILLLSPDGLAHRHCVVRWRSRTEVGVEFTRSP